MKFNDALKKTLSYLRSHIAISSMIGILIVFTLTVSATQLLAPIENKPGTLIKKLFGSKNISDDSDSNKKSTEDQTSTTQVEPEDATEKLPPASDLPSEPASQAQVVPAKVASLFKTEYPKDVDQCTFRQITVYSNVSNTSTEYDKIASMGIINRLDSTDTPLEKEKLALFDTFLNRTNTKSPVTLFNYGCSGFSSIHLYDLPIAYPGTDNVRAAVFIEGQDIVAQATVRIYATKGTNTIELMKAVIPYTTDKSYYVSLFESCQKAESYEDCYEAGLQTPDMKAKAEAAAQDLVEAFAL